MRLPLVLFAVMAALSGPAHPALGRSPEKPLREAADEAGQPARGEAVDWPLYGPARPGLALDGHTNTLPDVVGPVDGSARLTIFTEGNHFPVLLPLVLEAFPRWCAETGRCDVRGEDILVATLPQTMIVTALTGGGARFGAAYLPLRPDGPVFPDLVMGGRGPLTALAAQGLVEPQARVFARHLGLGLLLRRDFAGDDLSALAGPGVRLAIATPREAGARRQYEATLQALAGPSTSGRIMARDIGGFAGRLGIQHRDVPYALLNDYADAGIIFGHLAAFYAATYPDRLRHVPVPDAAPFGQVIAVARARRASPAGARDAFLDFLMEAAPDAYERGGFENAAGFDFGGVIALEE